MITAETFAVQSPFQRLRGLLAGHEPGLPPIDMTIGEPKHTLPQFVIETIARHAGEFAKYPPIAGIPQLRNAIAAWITQRSTLREGVIDPEKHVLPLCGTREGLVSALVVAAARKWSDPLARTISQPVVLMPNPFYQAYYAAALAAGCKPVFLDAGRETGYLPDLDAIAPALLEHTAAVYIASPANPQGAVASGDYLAKLIELARQHRFYVFADECYSELYRDTPPVSAIAVAAATGSLDRVLVFNSLSKRSNAPGLRSGFIAGDAAFIADFLKFRNVACPQVPLPIQHASAALWSDEGHVVENRGLYDEKFRQAEAHLKRLPNYDTPAGGFFLWLDVSMLGGGEAAALTLWKRCGVKVVPGAYFAQPSETGVNPGAAYVRIALVEQPRFTAEALGRIAGVVL